MGIVQDICLGRVRKTGNASWSVVVAIANLVGCRIHVHVHPWIRQSIRRQSVSEKDRSGFNISLLEYKIRYNFLNRNKFVARFV